jgi:hypothetical protein
VQGREVIEEEIEAVIMGKKDTRGDGQAVGAATDPAQVQAVGLIPGR